MNWTQTHFPPSNREGAMQMAFHFVGMLATGLLIANLPLWLVPIAMVLHGILLVALFAPNHECVHRTVFRTKWLNDAFAWIIGWLLFMPSVDFRYFHFAHHRHTQDPDLDPELASPKPDTLAAYWWTLTGVPLWIGTAKWFYALVFGGAVSSYLPASKQMAARRQAIIYLVGYGAVLVFSVLFASWHAVLYWLGPLVLAQPFLRAYLLAEHFGCDDEGDDMFATTRTVLSNPLVRAIMWNMPLHAEHHAYPTVPFYALPTLHQKSAGRHRHLEPSYRQTHKRIRTLL